MQHHSRISGLAYEARKAPGGAYQHNIFHQSEHLYCMLSMAIMRNENPDVILWPYQSMPWTRALASLVLPNTTWEETCCGPANVAAKWWLGQRRICSCWQKICLQRRPAFWPGRRGSIAHARLRKIVRERCGLHLLGGGAEHHRGAVVRVLERPSRDGRQIENREEFLRVVRGAVSGAHVEFAVTAVSERALPTWQDANRTRAGTLEDGRISSAPFLCEQVRWFAGASIIVLTHGAQTTNAIFADPGATVIDVTPYGHQPSPSAPAEYYGALLQNTDINYITQQASAHPRTPLSTKAAQTLQKADVAQSSERCRTQWACTVAFRDHCCMRLSQQDLADLRLKLEVSLRSRRLHFKNVSL